MCNGLQLLVVILEIKIFTIDLPSLILKSFESKFFFHYKIIYYIKEKGWTILIWRIKNCYYGIVYY